MDATRTATATTTTPLHIVGICQINLGSSGGIDNGGESSRALLTNDGMLVRVDEQENIAWTVRLNEICSGVDTATDTDTGTPKQGQGQGQDWFSLTMVDPGLVCMSSSGAIVTVSPETGHAELVGEFENGIQAGAWSPDGEVLLLVTLAEAEAADDESKKKSVILTMNSSWEVLAEVDMENTSAGNVDSTVNSVDSEHAKVFLCWRPDGTLCAISSVDASDSMRKIRIYERETLAISAVGRTEDGSGKLVPNLQATAIAWASVGCSQVLAAVQRKGKKTQQVAFFEPNGLRHREFVLREEPDTSVIGLDWNVESDLLAVTLRTASCDKVQLWHRSNYHWYLKKEFRYAGKRVACASFHEEQPYLLYVVFELDYEWREYRVRWDAGSVRTLSNSCTAFSIDGCRLSSTPLHKAVVPPPYYAATLDMSVPIAEMAFSHDASCPVTAVVSLSDGSLVLVDEGKDNDKSEMVPSYSKPGILAVVSWPENVDLDPISLRNFLVVDTDASSLRLLAVAPAMGDGFESLVEILVSWNDQQEAQAHIVGTLPLEERVLTMVQWSDSLRGALIELEDSGELLEYACSGSSSGTLLPSEAEPLLEPCQWIAGLKDTSTMTTENGSHIQRQRLVVGLTARSRLYCHDLLLCDSASSFVLTTEHQFLCYASAGSQCQIRFIPLADLHNFDPLMGSDENYILEGYEPRNIERGGRVVAVLPQQPSAILQMPRGNMEGIFPRALVLRFAMLKITNGEYKESFLMMRRQKVDLNILLDLNIWKFLDTGVIDFIEQVESIDHLNLLIAGLQNWDVTQGRYVVPGWFRKEDTRVDPENEEEFDFATKVNQVCLKLRSVMREAERAGHTLGGRSIQDGHFLLPILSTFAKENPPQLVEALHLIKENALSSHSATSRKPPLFSDRAQSSIQYLAFLADYELLFETALGIYDYDIARAVARNSQMDPKVYLPLLKRYAALPKFYGRYEVDLRIKRYESALRNLCTSSAEQESLEPDNQVLVEQQDVSPEICNAFEHCMTFIEREKLHTLGLEIFKSPEQRRQIILSLSDHLVNEKRPRTALHVVLTADPIDMERALSAARASSDWKILFSLLSEQQKSDQVSAELSSQKRSLLARDVADELAANAFGKFNRRETMVEAARVLLDYGDDAAGAVDMLTRAETWSEAHRIGLLHSRDDLVRKCVDATVSYAHTTISDLEERCDTFCTSNTRYAEVLTIRKKAIEHGEGEPGETNENDDNGSLFSAASNVSGGSASSMRSNTSSTSVSSISSVISAKSSSSFSLSEADASNKHKSKYNQVGRGGKKKSNRKKTKKGRSKTRPGSLQELQDLVETMRSSCVDEQYCQNIAETAIFLGRVREIDLARALYDSYVVATDAIQKSQEDRIEADRKEKLKEENRVRREGTDQPEPIILDTEKVVDAMTWPSLPDTLHELFSFLPASQLLDN
jgi:elongator complex protein 1